MARSVTKAVQKKGADKGLFFLVIGLVVVGYIIFFSASLGLLGRDETTIGGIALKQAVVGILGGAVALFVCSIIPTDHIRRFSPWIFIGAIFVNMLIFIPGMSISAGGATRWLDLGFISFQPGEMLKFAAVLFYAALLRRNRDEMDTFKGGLLPLLAIGGITTGILLLQRDTDPIIGLALVLMFFVSGGRWKDLIIVALIACVGIGGLLYTRPYVLDRVKIFIDPSQDSLGSGYQVQQSLIAIGNGGFWGQGFGQSVQKFKYLPEPVGDSIFAVAGEEFGFAGAASLVILYLVLSVRLSTLASRTRDAFGRAVIIGFLTLIVGQSFMNIGAMVSILPLTGVPLAFISHGGTALLFALAEIGIILGISKGKSSSSAA
ncbi:MAG TPA: FtsW/RodA/SpoVE family cell cycle protein [Candidatus Paceibacterota bacterium]|nr:FtsW/RodA/SpoVE family cell cycle protein [Candidatus Paceibacterota bacterium]